MNWLVTMNFQFGSATQARTPERCAWMRTPVMAGHASWVKRSTMGRPAASAAIRATPAAIAGSTVGPVLAGFAGSAWSVLVLVCGAMANAAQAVTAAAAATPRPVHDGTIRGPGAKPGVRVGSASAAASALTSSTITGADQ